MSKPTETSVLDLSVLRDGIGDSPKLIAEVVAGFLLSLDPELDALRRAVDQADTTALARAAHRIKGAALAVGANKLAELGESVEVAASIFDWNLVHQLVQRFPIAAEELARAIRTP